MENFTIEQKEGLRIARQSLLNVQAWMPAYREDYKRLNGLISEIESLLGVK